MWLAAVPAGTPQDQPAGLDELVRMGTQLLEENLDESLLQALGEVDLEQAQAFFEQFDQKLQGQQVLDLVRLKMTAQTLLPVLAAHDETAPFADWLRTRMDYLEAAEQLQKEQPKPPKPPPGKVAPPPPNPTPAQEQKVWHRMVEKRPLPQGADRLAPTLKPLFTAQGVPAELVWLAEVESSFNPRARSPVGAAGLFQLMPATAKSLGLSTWPFDERLNAEKSATAAARYLKYLHGRFKDWKLALAAYNVGEGRLRSLLAKTKNRTFEGVSAALPAETQMYVPKIEATLQLRESVTLAQLDKR